MQSPNADSQQFGAHHVKISLNVALIVLAFFSTAWTYESSEIPRNTQYIKVLAIDIDGMPFSQMVKAYGEPTHEYWAVKLQGRSSYFTWRPDNMENPEIPEDYKEFVRLETEHNIRARQGEIYKTSKGVKHKVYSFLVPLQDASLFVSPFIESQRRDKFLVAENPTTYDPMEPFILKMSLEIDNTIYNSGGTVSNAVNFNDVLHAIAERDTGLGFAFLPEQMGSVAENEDEGFEFTNIIRSLQPINAKAASNAILLPLHGFLGSALVEEMAAKKDMDAQNWIRSIYIPELARFTAVTNFENGIFLEGHSQNTLIRIDKATGDIVEFVARDLNDVTYDKNIRLSRNKSLHEDVIEKELFGQIGSYHVDVDEAKDAGWNIGIYTGQSVIGMEPSNVRKFSNTHKFLEAYIEETEKITGIKIQLSEQSQKIMSFVSHPLNRLSNPLPPGRFGKQYRAMAYVIQDIYNQVSQALAPKPQSDELVSQPAIYQIFSARITTDSVVFASPEAREFLENPHDTDSLQFALRNGSLMAFRKVDGNLEFLAYTYKFSTYDTSILNEFFEIHKRGVACGSVASGF